jgi:hypothetical protein
LNPYHQSKKAEKVIYPEITIEDVLKHLILIDYNKSSENIDKINNVLCSKLKKTNELALEHIKNLEAVEDIYEALKMTPQTGS